MPVTKIKKHVFPKRIGTCVDKLETLRAKKSAHVAAAKAIEDKMKAEEAALVEHMRLLFKREGIEGADGRNKHAKGGTTEIRTVTDWPKFYAHIAKTKSWDLLQKRPSSTAIELRFASGKRVPGTGTIPKFSINLVKR